MPASSSKGLHPRTGARFVLERVGDHEPHVYEVVVWLPDVRLRTTLRWTSNGKAVLDPRLPDDWAHDEALKLARVLRRDPKSRLTRWRGRP